jgi:hypothetical protein
VKWARSLSSTPAARSQPPPDDPQRTSLDSAMRIAALRCWAALMPSGADAEIGSKDSGRRREKVRSDFWSGRENADF